MTTNNIVTNLEHKLSQIYKLGATDQITIECIWTDVLRELLTYGNVSILKNFHYELVTERD